jgi:Domain of unknown function (DUF4203)
MFFQTVIVSLLLIFLGLGLCFAGYRFFTILISIWGFFAGFQFGVTIFTNIFGEGFLRTVISWVVGLLIAFTAAALAYLFYAAAVVLLAGFVGYQLGVGIMVGFGVQEGWLTFLVGVLVGLALVALALYLHLPKVLVLILTALAGAGAILAGFFLAFGRISLADLQFGEVGALVRDNWIWGLLYLALAAVGILIQWGTTQSYVLEEYSAENPFATEGTGTATSAGETTAVAASASAAAATPSSTVTPVTDPSTSTTEANLDAPVPDTTAASDANATSTNGTAPDTQSSAPESAE